MGSAHSSPVALGSSAGRPDGLALAPYHVPAPEERDVEGDEQAGCVERVLGLEERRGWLDVEVGRWKRSVADERTEEDHVILRGVQGVGSVEGWTLECRDEDGGRERAVTEAREAIGIKREGRTAMHLCRICARRPADSQEHVPPRSANNRGRVLVRHMRMDTAPGSGVTHEVTYARDGFALPNLCRKCNTRTGGRYGGAYRAFVDAFERSGRIAAITAGTLGLTARAAEPGHVYVHLEGLESARVAKQMVATFLAAQPGRLADPLFPSEALRDFVLHQDRALPDGALEIYLYRNRSAHGRLVPVCSLGSLFGPGHINERSIICSEVSWPPVGLVFVPGGGGRALAAAGMPEVSAWGREPLWRRTTLQLRVPNLAVEADWPLGFGTAAQVDRWVDEQHLVWMIGTADDPAAPNAASMLWRREGRES